MQEEQTQKLLNKINALTAEVDKLVRYDDMTQLYNKNTFFESARKRLDDNPDKDYIIVCLDIEKFKYINERFSFAEGDRLLTFIGEKLKERCIKYNAIAARLSGDKFSFLDERKNIDPEVFGSEIQSWVKDYPLDADIKIAIGIYPVETRSIPVRLMCDRANMAVSTVKNNYMLSVAEYNKNIGDYIFLQNELLDDVERAFSDREFKLYFQPKYDIRTNRIVGAEGLVRWHHPKRGVVPPKDFIPLFEHNMIITRLDEYVWEEACRLIREWLDKGYNVVPISVNVSRRDIYSLEVSNKFHLLTDKYGIDRKYIEIEITESAFTNDENQIIRVVDDLRGSGFKVLMDDFGSGYSSLNILKDINVDVLKIDTRFLEAGRNSDNRGKEILESVIRMAKWMGLSTIAEGVETEEHKRFLMDLGCYYAQGYYFSKPIPTENFELLIKNAENVDLESGDKKVENVIEINELFHSDFMTESLINNILGGVAIYTLDEQNVIKLVKANEFYYALTSDCKTNESDGLLDIVHTDDRELVLGAFKRARTADAHGISVNMRIVKDDKECWFSMRIFFLADKKGDGMYYASVSDFTDQIRLTSELEMSRRGFETALELIDAIVLEYDFENGTAIVKTQPGQNQRYLMGTKIERAFNKIVENGVVHKDSIKPFYDICEHLRKSGEPVSDVITMLNHNQVYRKCSVTAKTVMFDKKPLKAIIVVKPID